MGLLDSLGYGNQGGYGGLLDMLMYNPQANAPAPGIDPNGEVNPYASPFGAAPQSAPLPPSNAAFGPVPQFGPQPPMMSAPSMGSMGQPPGTFSQMAPALPPAINVGSGGNVAPLPDMPTQTAGVGGGASQAPQASATDFSSQNRPGPQELPPALGGDQSLGFLDRVNRGLQSIGNGGSIIGTLTGNRTDPQSISQQNLAAEFKATKQILMQSGLPEDQANSRAMLAIMNKKAGETILPEALTNKTELKMVKDALGAETPYAWNNREGTLTPINSEGGSNGIGAGPKLLADGVAKYNPSLSGEAYLNQFSPDVKAAVNAYIKGDVLPSGNPRQQAIASMAKTFAQKYGADMGIPVSDALYAEKRKYRTELGTNSANSAGGQAKAFNQGISHMTTLATTLEKLDNSNGLGIPIIAQGVNATRQGFSTEQSAISDEAKSLGQTVAGEVGKLFSGSAGGGVHEREMTRERFDTVKSKPQLAAALRATLETMQGGLQALEQRRDSILGPNSGVDLVNEATRQNIAKIQGAIDRLEGKSNAGPSGGIPSGWTVKVH